MIYWKALHLIGVVCWFAGLFYIVRLYIYHVEAFSRPKNESDVLVPQFELMEKRLWYGITVPSMIITLVAGLVLMMMVQAWMFPWFHVKVGLLVGLFSYHFYCGHLRKRLALRVAPLSSQTLRLWNEVATFFLVGIILLAVTKKTISFLYGWAVFLLLAVLIFSMIGIRKRKMKGVERA